MSVSTIAGQITTLAGHPPMRPAAPTKKTPQERRRERLRNHETLARTTIKGRGAILFGAVFVGMGAMIFLLAGGIIPTEEGPANAPLWLVGVCAAVFALPGAWVMCYGVATSIGDARVRRQQERFPDSPWCFDYAWREWGTTYSDSGTIRQTCFFLLVAGGLMSIGHFVAYEGGRGLWFLWIGLGLFDLFLVYGVFYLVRAMLRRLLYGRSRLRFDRFPFRLGERLDVTWLRPRGMGHGSQMTCTLRCVEEAFESTGSEGGQAVVAYATYVDQRTVEPPMDRSSAFAEVPLSFQLPVDAALETRLRDHPPRYWQLEIKSATRGVDYLARFLVPVYGA